MAAVAVPVEKEDSQATTVLGPRILSGRWALCGVLSSDSSAPQSLNPLSPRTQATGGSGW